MTAAFSDLIVKQNEIMFKNAKQPQQPQQPLEKPQKEPLSTTNPEDDEDNEEFAEFDPRYQFVTSIRLTSKLLDASDFH